MSSSGKTWLHVAARYGVVAVGCMAFNLAYAQFAHGVSSPFMTFMFAIPLAMGALPAAAMRFCRRKLTPAWSTARQAWGLAVATLTIASCLHGVFDIAGTASPWLIAYLVVAGIFGAVAAVFFVRCIHAA